MGYLMVLNVGPVQEFIATARRSRDLWFGSWLLSEISKAAAKTIYDHEGCELIFPDIDRTEDLEPVVYLKGKQVSGTRFIVVNKLIALIGIDPGSLGDEIEKAMKDRLEIIRRQAFAGIPGIDYIDVEKARLQVADLTELYWAAQPVSDDLTDYAQARTKTEALLAARKSLRDFVQPTAWSGPAPKSSLDGLRESVIDDDVYKTLGKEELRRELLVREGERLCGVGLLKRHGNRQGDDSFFSTSHVAALPLMDSLRDARAINGHKKAFDEYVGKLKELGVRDSDLNSVPIPKGTLPHPVFGKSDGHLLFSERLGEFFDTDTKDQAQKQANENKLAKAREYLSHLLKDRFKVAAPKPYYALLHADGDRMGEAIDAQDKKDNHKKISKRLSQFATTARQIVEEQHKGSLVYAGGDDVLAFLPLHEALFCARRLADEFRSALGEFKKEGKPPTLSVGIAVGHHLDPLQDTLNLAREAEKAAKKLVKDKNALAIIVSKRSGADWLVKGSWCDSAADKNALDNRLNYFIYLYLQEALPRGVGHELRDAALRLRVVKDKAMNDERNKVMNAALRTEALRIIRRKRTTEGKLKSKLFEKMAGFIEDDELSIDDLAYQLITARSFAEAIKQASSEKQAGLVAKAFAERAGLKELEETENRQ